MWFSCSSLVICVVVGLGVLHPPVQIEECQSLRPIRNSVELLCVLGLTSSLISFGLYDARARTMIRRVAAHFSVVWADVGAAEDAAFLKVNIPLPQHRPMLLDDSHERCVARFRFGEREEMTQTVCVGAAPSRVGAGGRLGLRLWVGVHCLQ